MTQSAYFHFINCSLTIYIVNIMYILLLIYLAWKAVVITINCLFGTLYKSLWVLLAKSINISGVPCPKRDIEGCFSLECERNGRSGKSLSGSWECHVCGDLVFLSLDVCRKRLFLLIKIIELCVNDQGIHKVCRFDHKQMFRPVSVELWLSDKNQVKSTF